MLDNGIGTWEEESFVSIITPAHPIRRCPVLTLDSDHDGLTDRLSGVVAPDDDLVSDGSLHANASLRLG